MVTRVPVLEVRPCIERGRHAATVVPGESLPVDAIVLADDAPWNGAEVVLTDPDGARREPVPLRPHDGDVWSATVRADAEGRWTYHVESWYDPLIAWAGRVAADLDSGDDPELLLARISSMLLGLSHVDPVAAHVAADVVDPSTPALERVATALAYVESKPTELGRQRDATDPLPLRVDRERALSGSWYQVFPASEGALVRSDGTLEPGTLRTTAKRLESIAAMGFDVVRLPPIHPSADGSPWSIGTSGGGHLAIDPSLGRVDDVTALVERARQLGLEVALELSWTVSSTHPWLASRPEWFVPDGHGGWDLDLDARPAGAYVQVLQVVRGWIDRGIRLFVFSDAQRWPVAFWEQLLHDVARLDPDVVAVADADASPAHAHALAVAGFHQVTPPLTRARGVQDVEDLLRSLVRGSLVRPHLLASSAHRLPERLVGGGAEHFRAWAALAALAGPTWGVAAGYELLESDVVTAGRRQARDVSGPVVRDWDSPTSIAPFLMELNEVRRAHPALRRRRGLTVHPVHHVGVVAFSRRLDDDEVLVVIDLYPGYPKTVRVDVRLATAPDGRLCDELDGSWHLTEAVHLDPASPVRVLTSAG